MFGYVMYDCPACGANKSSHDGITFCGPCEESYRKEQAAQERAEDAAFLLRVSKCGELEGADLDRYVQITRGRARKCDY